MSYKSFHILHYLTSRPTRVSTSYTTSPVVLQVSTSYTTSTVVLQEFPHPTLPHQSSYKSSHILHYLTSHSASFHILHYLISRPKRVSTSYTTSTVILQEFPHPTLPHQLSCKHSQSYTTSPVVLQVLPCKHSQSYTTSLVVLEVHSLEELGSLTRPEQQVCAQNLILQKLQAS